MVGPGVVIAERFRLVELLGEGGMGSVWKGWHEGLDVPCAVKIIRENSADPETRGRFEREAKAAASLRSPHVVQIFDHGVWQNTPYIAMELLEGEDLATRLEQQRRLRPADVASIVTQVARALTKAHAAGLVHRDLKPGNIFLARDDDQEIAKVLDFGIAKASSIKIGGAATKTGSLLGTPFYMSPEQSQGTKAIDHRSDLWSLAVVVFECMTGVLPFESEALGELLMQIMVKPLPVPSTLAPVPPGFDAWWQKAAAREPEGRFQTPKEFAEALASALGVSSASMITAGGRYAFSEDSMSERSGPYPVMSAPVSVPRAPVSSAEALSATAAFSNTGPVALTRSAARTDAAPTGSKRVMFPVVVGVGIALVAGVAAFFAVTSSKARSSAAPVALSAEPSPIATATSSSAATAVPSTSANAPEAPTGAVVEPGPTAEESASAGPETAAPAYSTHPSARPHHEAPMPHATAVKPKGAPAPRTDYGI